MPLIEANFDQDYEDKPVPEGRYDLRIEQATDQRSKKGADQVMCMIRIDGEEGAAPIFHYLTMPVGRKQAENRGIEPDDDNQTRNKMRFVTRFLHLFGIPYDKKGFNTEDLAGATAKEVALTLEVSDDQTERNVIKLPPVPHQ